MRDISELNVTAVKRLFREASGVRLAELVHAYSDDPRPGVQCEVQTARRRLSAEQAEARRLEELYRMETDLRKGGAAFIAGLDECGRGAIAGPLTVGACVLPASPRIHGLDDSKRLSPQRREELAARIRAVAVACAVIHIPASDVDRDGLSATLRRAMQAAVEALATHVDHVIVDGRPMGLFPAESAVIGGDRRVAAVAAASIIAKVERDTYMRGLARVHPQYGFEVHKGYGTAEHLTRIRTFGLCPEHRRSFTFGGGTERLF